MYDYGYVAALFHQKDVDYSRDLVNDICNKEDFCGEKGDVTDKLHLTLLYGIKENEIVKVDVESYIKKIRLEEIRLGGMELFTKLWQVFLKEPEQWLSLGTSCYQSFLSNEPIKARMRG